MHVHSYNNNYNNIIILLINTIVSTMKRGN